MAKKTVKVIIPLNMEELTETTATLLARNDGAAPALPSAAPVVQDLANRLGVTINIPPVSPPTPGTVPPGTNLIPANLIAPLRALYPQVARDVVTLAVLDDYTAALSTSLMNRLGLADGQTLENSGTVRAILSRITPVLKSLLVGNENEIETYGLSVTLGTTASPGGPTPPPSPTP